MKVDLHIHSMNSDGSQTPQTIIEKCYKEGFNLITLSDHNIIQHTKPFLYKDSLAVIPGCEFSCFHKVDELKKEIHIVGIFPSGVESNALDNLNIIFDRINDGKSQYIMAVLNFLEVHHDIHITEEELSQYKKKNQQASRFTIARALMARGYGSMSHIMDTMIGNRSYMGKNLVKTVDYIYFPPMKTVIDLIHASNGYAILAHPFTYGLSDDAIPTLIHNFAQANGDGLEVYYNDYLVDESKIELLSSLANKHGLFASISSDHHRTKDPFAKYIDANGDLYNMIMKSVKFCDTNDIE